MYVSYFFSSFYFKQQKDKHTVEPSLQLLPASSTKIVRADSRVRPLPTPPAKHQQHHHQHQHQHQQQHHPVARGYLWKQSKRQPDMFKRRWCSLDVSKCVLSFARSKDDEMPRTVNLKEGTKPKR